MTALDPALHPGESELFRVGRDVNRPPISRRPSLDVSFLAFLLAHIPLGLAMKAGGPVASLHGTLVIPTVMLSAFLVRRPAPAVYGMVYLAACGVLWRMTGAGMPWEIGKYGLALSSLVLVYRFSRRLPNMFIVWYLLLLVPSALIAFLAKGMDARDGVSFNLSGPFALACAAMLFSVVRMELHEFRRLSYMAAAPVAGVWAIAFQALLETENFGTASSKAAVGGFGPNQVSTVLGFGALVCIMWAVRDEVKIHRVFLAVIGVTFLVQSVMTFSRGGLYNVLAALFMAMILYIRRPSRIIAAIFGIGLIVIALLPVLSGLNEFTGGALQERFEETDVTGRDELAAGDVALFREEPVTGVGVGRSKSFRLSGFNGAAAHTEFTRILAEHGILGLLALGSLGIFAIRNLSGRTELWEQAWSMALMVWTAAAMTNAAMRVAVISLAFAMASARLTPSTASVGQRSPVGARRLLGQHQPPVAAVPVAGGATNGSNGANGSPASVFDRPPIFSGRSTTPPA